MTAVVTGLVLLGGPFVALGIWLWLRSRRAPVLLGEPLDMGQVLGNSFAVFRPENIAVPAMALLLLGLPSLVWQLVFQPAMQSGLQMQSKLPPGLRPNPLAIFANAFSPATLAVLTLNFVLASAFYVAATLYLVRRYENRPVAIADLPGPTLLLVVPAIVVAVLAYVGVVLGLLVFVVPGIVLALSWSVMIPVLVVERTGILRCFGRSRALAIGSRGRILVLLLLVFVLGVAVSAASGAVAGGFRPVPTQPGAIGLAFRVIVAMFSGSLFAAFFAALYVELRRIREGMASPDLAEVFA